MIINPIYKLFSLATYGRVCEAKILRLTLEAEGLDEKINSARNIIALAKKVETEPLRKEGPFTKDRLAILKRKAEAFLKTSPCFQLKLIYIRKTGLEREMQEAEVLCK